MLYADAYGATTGYSIVAKNLAEQLAKDGTFDVYFQQIVDNSPAFITPEGVKVLPAFAERGTQVYLNGILNHLKIIAPDIFVPISDTFLMVRDGIHNINYTGVDLCPYVLIDANDIPDNSFEILDKATKIFTASKHGQKQLDKFFYPSEVIYHGVEKVFKPSKDKEERDRIRALFGYDPKDVVFLFIGRNFPRKRPLRLLEAYAIHKKNNPDSKARLLCHMSDRNNQIYNIERFIRRLERKYNVTLDIKFTEDHQLGKGAPVEQIAKMYQLSDFYISAASGEGFGLPIVEAMACGKVPILADNTTTEEFLKDSDGNRGLIAGNIGQIYVGFSTNHDIVDIKDLAGRITEAVNMPRNHYKMLSKKCIEFAKENCDWQKIGKQFAKSLQKVIDKREVI